MHKAFRKLVNHRQANSLAARMRRKRFKVFFKLTANIQKPITILDLGGEQSFWEVMGLAGDPDYQVVLLNIQQQPTTYANIQAISGDVTDLQGFSEQSFDLLFSNSVIEHLGSYENQKKMAQEVLRVGKHFYIQTPNRNFPLEPHFLVPFFQFFPASLQILLVQKFDLGWYPRIPDRTQARQFIRSHRLLTKKEMLTLFPGCSLYQERFFGLVKSFIAYG